ncbi:MAG: hypothetical protein BWY86_01060 [Candidatus Aminicenantes bacterium ADurb.Bin508]|nr:MAG: hypothetical protein BWY86_01060 [Candidatus Aminicenantes bacterium ADurb.Bin508]
MKKAACITVLILLPKPTSSEIFRALMLKKRIFLAMMVSCISLVRWSKTSSLLNSELSRKVPPSLISFRRSYRPM